MEYQDDITIHAAPERVYEALADVRRWAEWMPEAASVKVKGGDDVAEPGDEFSLRRKGWFADTWTLEKAEPMSRVVARSGAHTLTYLLAENGPGDVQVRVMLQVDGLTGKLEEAFEAGSVRKEIAAELRGLKDYCERA